MTILRGEAAFLAMPVEDINVIDAIAEDTRTGEIVLLMHEPRPWKHGDRQLFQLQEKLNTYLSFALDGEMEAEHPGWVGRPLRVQLDCAAPPSERARAARGGMDRGRSEQPARSARRTQ